MTNQSELATLIRETKQLIIEQYPEKGWVASTTERTDYYRALAKQPKPQVKAQPTQKQTPSPPPPSPSPSPQKVKEEVKKKSFSLEAPPDLISTDFSEFKALFQEKFPNCTLTEKVPEKTAQQNTEKDLESVILSNTTNKQELTLLKNLAHALTTTYGMCKVVSAGAIEKQNAWEKLFQSKTIQLILAEEDLLKQYPTLDQSNKSLLTLAKISHYLQDPSLKKILWKTIRQHYEKG